MSLRDRLFVWLQYLIPQHTLSALVNRLTRWRWKPWKNALIRAAVRHFQIDLSEASDPSPHAYSSFNQFFTRPLAEGARPIEGDAGRLVCPADGVISQLGSIDDQQLLQAKGQQFAVSRLLTDQVPWQAHCDGQFLTVYLSPRDYHRVHMPLAGRLLTSVYVPGKLFSVAPATTRAIPGLFARNERLVCWFETDRGPMSVILVGAVCVSAIECVWSGAIEPARDLRTIDHRADDVFLERGAEMGRFNMGSTVILTLPPDSVRWKQNLSSGVSVRMGQCLEA